VVRSTIKDVLDAQDRERSVSVPVGERVVLMLEMGERQLQDFMRANSLGRGEAMRRVEHSRQLGRRPSRCMEEIIDASRPDSSRDP